MSKPFQEQRISNLYSNPRIAQNHRLFIQRLCFSLGNTPEKLEQLAQDNYASVFFGWDGDRYDPYDEFDIRRDWRIEIVDEKDKRWFEPIIGFPDDAEHNTTVCKPLYVIHVNSGSIMYAGAFHVTTHGATIAVFGNKAFNFQLVYLPCVPPTILLDSKEEQTLAASDLTDLSRINALLQPPPPQFPKRYLEQTFKFSA